jgi:hypothetical protein
LGQEIAAIEINSMMVFCIGRMGPIFWCGVSDAQQVTKIHATTVTDDFVRPKCCPPMINRGCVHLGKFGARGWKVGF